MVSIESCRDYDPVNLRAALEKTFKNLGGLDKYIKSGMKVALKPNLVAGKKPEEAATTHPVLIGVLTSMIKEAGGEVTIVESPGGLYNERVLKSVYSACGVEKAALETGALLNYDISEKDVENPEGKLLKKVTVLKPLVEADIIINIPKLKSHGQMVYTGAVKNMFGAVPGVLKAEYHFRMAEYHMFANALIDIFLSVKPALNIMDAVTGMEGNGPTAGTPRHIGLIMASEDAFELDFSAISVIGANPMDIPVIRHASDRGFCPSHIDHISIEGESISNVRINNFSLPGLNNPRDIQFYKWGIFKHIAGRLTARPVVSSELCIGCSECALNCPPKIIDMKDRRPKINLSGCIRCYCCQELCPQKAIDIKRPFFTKFLKKR